MGLCAEIVNSLSHLFFKCRHRHFDDGIRFLKAYSRKERILKNLILKKERLDFQSGRLRFQDVRFNEFRHLSQILILQKLNKAHRHKL